MAIERIIVGQITDIIDKYGLYQFKINKDKRDLFWETANNGENSLTALRLKKQLQADEFSLHNYKKEEIK